MTPNLYILDANVFIEAAKNYYAFDLAPGFWKSLQEHMKSGSILTIDRVGAEISRGKDELSEWIEKKFEKGIASSDLPEVIEVFKKMMIWVESQKQFGQAAKAEFATVADGWILAFAKVKNATVVTHEVYKKDIKWKVPMPNVCRGFAIPHIDTFELLRRLKVTLG